MRKVVFFFIGFLIISSIHPLKSQELILNSSVTGVCYAGKKVNRIYIPPPAAFFKKTGRKGGGSVKIYYTGFSNQAKTAMEYAASILESMLPADANLTILASLEQIATPGVLGHSTITGYVGGWGIDALNPNAIYPVALAEKIAGRNLNEDTQGDLQLVINSSINWYLGTDGNTPTDKYDLITVALHEICHGLGFFDSFSTDETIGWYGIDSIPMIYDTFVEDLLFNKLTDTLKFLNYSGALRSKLTGGQLYFDGPLLKNYTSGSRAKLYVPAVWDAGSSVSHLDESSTLPSNALMTPFIDLGEAIHNPGNYTFSILGDLGWINTRIIHEPMHDTERHLSEAVLSVTIKSDTLYNRDKVGLVYSYDKFFTSDTIIMTSPNSDDNFTSAINIPSYNTDLSYYFFTEDYFKRLYRSPSMIELFKYQVYIGVDTVKPKITHTPVDYYLESVDSVIFKAGVTDNLGIDSVYTEYILNEGTSIQLRLNSIDSVNYSGFVNARLLSLKGGDSIRYRIIATDSAHVPNTTVLPETGYFVIRIEGIGSVLESYTTDFTGVDADFLNDGFSIEKPSGFSNYGLNTRHPYASPEDNDKSIEYTAMLRHPIKFNESGLLINYDEIVLVEPGEPGSVFGSTDFYDYVIVEGSKNFGKSWFKLTDGYDSRIFPPWESAYNSSIVGQNSTFIPTEAMLRKHTVYYRPTDKISAGDTLLVRFRLFSDPFANGWGWVIENLKLGPLVDAVENIFTETVKVYPNPGRGLIRISTDQPNIVASKPFRYSIFNSAGICILNSMTSDNTETLVDISGYPTGLYIIVLYRDDGIKTFKYSLIK